MPVVVSTYSRLAGNTQCQPSSHGARGYFRSNASGSETAPLFEAALAVRRDNPPSVSLDKLASDHVSGIELRIEADDRRLGVSGLPRAPGARDDARLLKLDAATAEIMREFQGRYKVSQRSRHSHDSVGPRFRRFGPSDVD